MDSSKRPAKDFLIELGMAAYVEELVTKNKFETVSDLEMLTDLEDTSSVFQKINLPLSIVLKLKKAIKSLSTESHAPGPSTKEISGSGEMSGRSVQEDDNNAHKEIPKKKLVELMTVSMDAQYANTQVNAFTNFIAGKVKEFLNEGKWQGAGGLRVSAGTTLKQAQENCILAQSILNSEELVYGCYMVKGHGVVTLNRKRGKAFIGNKLSHMRKPSAYKGKETGRSVRSCARKEDTSKEKVKKPNKEKSCTTKQSEKAMENEDLELESDEEISQNQGACEKDIEEESIENESEEEEETEFLKRRRQNIEENNRKMLQLGLLTNSQATIVGLFYLQVKQMKHLNIKAVKEACKKNNVAFQRSMGKEKLCQMLGEYLFKSKKIIRINEEDIISYGNLKCTVKKSKQ